MHDEYRTLFPVDRAVGPLDTILATAVVDWSAAAANGATLGWALQAAGATAGADTTNRAIVFRVLGVLRLASAAPVSVTDDLRAYGWGVEELHSLMAWRKADRFPETVCRLGELYKAVSGAGGPDSALLWHALTAVVSAGPAGLTDLQALRWVQVFVPERPTWVPRVGWAMRFADDNAAVLQEWVPVAGPDGWLWAAAGYTPAETRVLLGLPEAHPNRPGPDQLAVMAALQK